MATKTDYVTQISGNQIRDKVIIDEINTLKKQIDMLRICIIAIARYVCFYFMATTPHNEPDQHQDQYDMVIGTNTYYEEDFISDVFKVVTALVYPGNNNPQYSYNYDKDARLSFLYPNKNEIYLNQSNFNWGNLYANLVKDYISKFEKVRNNIDTPTDVNIL